MLLVAVTLLLYFSVAIVGRMVQMYELRQEQARLEQELAALAARRQELERLKEEADSDAYLERVAREHLGLVKPGEIGVVVIPPPLAPEAPPAAQVAPAPVTPPGARSRRAVRPERPGFLHP
ncbi:MAG: septum formation initiator family protein [Chloroflexi bacterium]|nr:septum formation initiator family protein [Chloroflexota bacterium]